MPNFQRSNKINSYETVRTVKELSEKVSYICNKDLIDYLEVQNQKQQKHDKINFNINLIIVICTVISLIISIANLIISIFK